MFGRTQTTRQSKRAESCAPRWAAILPMAAAALLTGAGCASKEPDKRIAIRNPYSTPFSFAVAPVLNFSGQSDFDPVQAADLLASELTTVDGVTVLPVNRVVAVLNAQGKYQIESPAHAIQVAQAVGADAILVAGITEYDAYAPTVGLALQMYVPPQRHAPEFNAIEASRQMRPFTVKTFGEALSPMAQVQRVYNGTHDAVQDAVEDYAKPRIEGEHPFGWRAYLRVQKLYLRFCWHDALRRLMDQESRRQTLLAAGDPEVGE